MFSKFKKVLFSLALASSLALAPMNVSAGNLTDTNQDFQTTANYQHIDHIYSVTVPDRVDFTSDALTQNMDIKVTDDLYNHSITVTPTFTANANVDASITFAESSVTITGKNSSSIAATLDNSKLAADSYLTSSEIGKISYNRWYSLKR